MAEMNGNIGEVTVTVNVGMEASEQFDAVAMMLGYVKERTCRYESTDRCTHVCTSCGREVETLHLGYNYCPNCGAKVVEE